LTLLLFMKRKFKQWWSTIQPISTKRTITSHFLTLHKKKQKKPPRHMMLKIRAIHWPCYCTVHGYILCDSMWSFRLEANLCMFSIVCLYLYFRWRSSYHDWLVGIPIYIDSCIDRCVSLFEDNTTPSFYASRSFSHPWLVTRFVTRVTRRMPLVEQELFTFPQHLGSPGFYCRSFSHPHE
jgi:hypothetical protein